MTLPGGSTPRPWLIQGGMGIAVSHWPLARAVAKAGQVGVVSGTGIDSVFVRRLQDDGVDADLRTVLDRFPDQRVVEDVLARFARARRSPTTRYRTIPMPTHRSRRAAVELTILASYAEVAQAKSGHSGLVGLNLLTKIQIPTVPSLYGAMLAGVDIVLMGAGIPAHVPGILDGLARGEAVDVPLSLGGRLPDAGAPVLHFDPAWLPPSTALRRPEFFGIVSSHVLATALARRGSGVVDGYVVERPIAGGHNAPPRGPLILDASGGPVYGARDEVDFAAMRDLGVPFYLAGGVTTPERVHEAIALGAAGVQVGTLFAYCRESGMDPLLRSEVMAATRRGAVHISTSTRVSSTGYPFKVAAVPGTLSEEGVYAERERFCDLGYLREAYVAPGGTIGYRCPAEPAAAYVAKGGALEDTVGRVCLCNALMATAGLGQVRRGKAAEPPIVTSGDEIGGIVPLAGPDGSYGAVDVIAYLGRGLAAGT